MWAKPCLGSYTMALLGLDTARSVNMLIREVEAEELESEVAA